MICEVQISVGEDTIGLQEIIQYALPFLVLLAGWIGIWWRNKIKARNETKLRKKVLVKWLSELKSSLDSESEELDRFLLQLNSLNNQNFSMKPLSFPVKELVEIDFEKNFNALVENLRGDESTSVQRFYNTRMIVNEIVRKEALIMDVVTSFVQRVAMRNELVRESWFSFLKKMQDGINNPETSVTKKIDDAFASVTSSMLEDESKEHSFDHCYQITEKTRQILADAQLPPEHREMYHNTRQFHTAYNDLKNLHESTSGSIKNINSDLKVVAKKLDVIVKEYEKAQVKGILGIKTF